MKTNPKPSAELTKAELCAMLAAFISQRPGLDFANYGDVSAYRSESRQITADMHDAFALLDAVAARDSLTADDMRAVLMGSGRLTLSEDGRLGYCTGQYFPTEYRKAAARALASMLWAYWRVYAAPLDPSPEGRRIGGESIRTAARLAFRRRSVLRYFN